MIQANKPLQEMLLAGMKIEMIEQEDTIEIKEKPGGVTMITLKNMDWAADKIPKRLRRRLTDKILYY